MRQTLSLSTNEIAVGVGSKNVYPELDVGLDRGWPRERQLSLGPSIGHGRKTERHRQRDRRNRSPHKSRQQLRPSQRRLHPAQPDQFR